MKSVNDKLIFYFLTKWGSEYIISAFNKERDSEELLKKLSETMSLIDKNTSVLNDTIVKSYHYIQTIEQVSAQTTTVVERIAEGVGEEAVSTEQIVEMTNNATKTIEQTKKLSGETKKYSDDMKAAVIKTPMASI